MSRKGSNSVAYPVEEDTIQLLPHHLDLWKHASLLYHAYEWQAAADAFLALALRIDSAQAQSITLTNAALIQIRLGDFYIADETLATAVTLARTSILTTFLVGLVSYELGDLAKAEGCLELCFDELGSDVLDHGQFSTKFVLDRQTVHTNLRAMREAQLRSKTGVTEIVPMRGIPADDIFEAPCRGNSSAGMNSEAGMIQGQLESFTFNSEGQNGPKGQLRANPVVRRADDPSLVEWSNNILSREASIISSPSDISPFTRAPANAWPALTSPAVAFRSPLPLHPGALSSIPERINSASDASQDVLKHSPSAQVPTNANRSGALHHRPTTPYTPRGARVDPESTRELARFIRTAGQNDLHNLLPKDAHGRSETIDELARFLAISSPEGSFNTAPVRPLDLDPFLVDDLRRDRQLQKKFHSQRLSDCVWSRSRTSSDQHPQHPRISVSSSDTSSTVPDAPDESYEFLLPTIFDPGKSKAYRRDVDTHEDCSARLKRAASTYPSARCQAGIRAIEAVESARKQSQLDYTLKVLEGKIGPRSERKPSRIRKSSLDKPLPAPPPPSDGDQSDKSGESMSKASVATEHFFEKVMGR